MESGGVGSGDGVLLGGKPSCNSGAKTPSTPLIPAYPSAPRSAPNLVAIFKLSHPASPLHRNCQPRHALVHLAPDPISGNPTFNSRLVATRLAKLSRRTVRTGKPPEEVCCRSEPRTRTSPGTTAAYPLQMRPFVRRGAPRDGRSHAASRGSRRRLREWLLPSAAEGASNHKMLPALRGAHSSIQ